MTTNESYKKTEVEDRINFEIDVYEELLEDCKIWKDETMDDLRVNGEKIPSRKNDRISWLKKMTVDVKKRKEKMSKDKYLYQPKASLYQALIDIWNKF